MISKKGIEFIASYEGFRSKPYLCPAGVATIGYGTTRYEGGRHVSMKDTPISKERALEILRHQVANHYGAAVDRYCDASTTQNQRDAMISFAYNLGTGALKGSSLLKYNNKHKYKRAAKEFGKWVHAGGRTLKGLVRRRKAEAAMYLA